MTKHDIKFLTLGLTLGFMALPLHAQENSGDARWVSDEITTWVRSGPTDGYRIVGVLTAGEPVTAFESSGDYTRVEDADGDEAWILTEELQEEPSARERLPSLQARVEALESQLDEVNDTWNSRVNDMTETLQAREQRIIDLQERNHELDAVVEQSSQTIRRLQARLDTQEEDLLMRYFMYGGGVAGAGLLVGLVVAHLPRRRKRRDRWF